MIGRGQAITFMEGDPGPHQTMKYIICELYGVRKYVSGARINHCSDL